MNGLLLPFDDRIAAYLWWFYGQRTDEVGWQCVSSTHDLYLIYLFSSIPSDRYRTWEAIHATCRYLAQQGVRNDGLN